MLCFYAFLKKKKKRNFQNCGFLSKLCEPTSTALVSLDFECTFEPKFDLQFPPFEEPRFDLYSPSIHGFGVHIWSPLGAILGAFLEPQIEGF